MATAEHQLSERKLESGWPYHPIAKVLYIGLALASANESE